MSSNKKIILSLFVLIQMLLMPVSAGVSNWAGPSTMDSTDRIENTKDGWQVASNATILDGWFNVSENTSLSGGNGDFWSAGVPVNNFTSSGVHDGTTGTHFDDLLSLSPNGSFGNVDTLDEITYNFEFGYSQSSPNIWDVGELTNVSGTVIGNSRIVPHGEIPALPSSGLLSAGTNIGSPLVGGTDSWLQTPSLNIPNPINQFTLSFTHWDHFAEGDGSWLEFRLDNGPWTWIEPDLGYLNESNTSAPIPNGATVNPHSGAFGLFGNTTSSGWYDSTFTLDSIQGISQASIIEFRLRVWTSIYSIGRPGIFIDDLQIENIGGSTGYWHHGYYNQNGVAGGYSNNANSALEVEVDLSTAVAPISIELTAEWDLEGSSYDNFLVESSDDGITWTDITNAGNTYGIPYNGYIVNGVNYGDESNGFLLMDFRIPASYAGDSTTFLRLHVTTDGSVTSGGTSDSLEGLTVDRIKVIDSNSVVHFDDHFTSASTATHYTINGIDDWNYVMIGAGGLFYSEGFENSPSVPSSEWTIANPSGISLFEYGTIATCTNCGTYSSPSNAASSPYGFATGLDTAHYDSNFNPQEAHVYSPEYVIPIGASARVVFDQWICSYSGYSAGALFISDDSGNTWDHFNPIDPNTGQGWYHGANMYNWYSHALTPNGQSLDVWDGSAGQGCNNNNNWDSMVGDITSFGGSTVQFRFTFVSVYNFDYPGWYVDNIGVEVDYFDSEGEWLTPLIPSDELGNGFVDIFGTSPPNGGISANLYDSNMNLIPGFVNREIPLSFSGLDLDSYSSGVHLGLNLETDNPFISPLIDSVSIGSTRFMLGFDPEVNGWTQDNNLETDDGNITTGNGQVGIINSDFIPSTRPIQEVYVDGEGSGVTVWITDSQGNQYGGLPLQSRIVFPNPLSGYGVQIEVGPGDWIEDFISEGEFWEPAFNPEIDAVDDGTIDWTFDSNPNYGHFGWQNRIAGDGLTATAGTNSEEILVGSTSSSGPPGVGTNSLTVSNNLILDGSHSYDVLTIANGGTISPSMCGALMITANEIIVQAGGAIIADSLVWDGPGAGGHEATVSGTGNGAGGAGHTNAGNSGGGNNPNNGGTNYGSGVECGSSGGNVTGNNPTTGGRGGTTLILTADSMIIDGSISSNGEDAQDGQVASGGTGPGGNGAGGGSAGSILLQANTISIGVAGSVLARGGNGGNGADGTQSGIGIGMHDGGNGGGSGSGGFIEIITSLNGLSNNGLVSVDGGTSGIGGAAYGSGNNGNDAGINSNDGLIQYNTFAGFSSVSSTTVLIPTNSSVYEGVFTLITDEELSSDLGITIAGLPLSTINSGWSVAHIPLDANMITSINGLSATHIDPNGREWSEVEIEFTTSGNSYDALLGSVAIGYHLTETVSGLEDQMYEYHEDLKLQTNDDQINIPFSFIADRGAVIIDGEIYHELMITNEPFTAPETIYPDGQDITIVTGHHHLYSTSEIDRVTLTGEATSGQFIQFELLDLQTNPTFIQSIGSEVVELNSSSSLAQLVGDSWMIDWVFKSDWSWDDEFEILWSSQAYNHTGYGLAPATALSGGLGTPGAVENDLEIDFIQFTDQLDRIIEFAPGIPPWVQGGSIVEVSGMVRFQNTVETRPLASDFVTSLNLSGMELVANSVGVGEWSADVLIPSFETDGSIRELVTLSPTILEAGPTGTITALDVTNPVSFSMRIDTSEPVINAIHARTNFGLKDADGYTWDPSQSLLLQLDIEEFEGMSDEVMIHYWRESLDDSNGDGIAQEDEYQSQNKGLIESRVGEQYIELPSINLDGNQNNAKVSLYVTGTDFVGLEFANGGAPGIENDLATVVTAINTMTELDYSSLNLDTFDDRLLLGQNHTLEMKITEGNGIETIDEIRIQLLGNQKAPRGEIIFSPKTNEWWTLEDDPETTEIEGSFVEIHGIEVLDLGSDEYLISTTFSLSWDFPVVLANNWQFPTILIYDDDLDNPLIETNEADVDQIRWKIDYEVEAVVDSLEDSTPPISEPSTSNLIIRQGDEVLVLGHIEYSGSGAVMTNVPSGLTVDFMLQYGSTTLQDEVSVNSDGSFEVSFLLPNRPLAKPTLDLVFEINGLPGNAEDNTNSRAEVTVDSTAPNLQFVGQTLNVLYSDNMDDLTVTVQVYEEIGMPQEPLTLNWVYRLNGADIAGSQNALNLNLVSVVGSIWTYQVNVDFNPENLVDLSENPQLIVWVDGTDVAGYGLQGEGIEQVPISPALVLKKFEPSISYIEVLPDVQTLIEVGDPISVTVTLVNEGNQEGVVNLSLVESDSQGIWRTVEEISVLLGPGESKRLDSFTYVVVRSGQQSLYLMLNNDSINLELVETPLVESLESQDTGFLGMEDQSLISLVAIFFIIVIISIIVVILRRDGDEEYWYDDEDDFIEEGKSGKIAPPPPVDSVSPPPTTNEMMFVSKWQDLPSNGEWDSRTDGTWYVTTDGQEWKQEEDGSFNRIV
ncbi:MAG: hypothetical protein CMB64_06320 [Euryarchaeota archaeon]|nr:hypothetical protein [Euryarchaeota archaeon]